jgi:hypothetical protein
MAEEKQEYTKPKTRLADNWQKVRQADSQARQT